MAAAMVYQGKWVFCTEYGEGSVVTGSDGRLYLALAPSAGKDPTNPANGQYWTSISSSELERHNVLQGLQGGREADLANGVPAEYYHVSKDVFEGLEAASGVSAANPPVTKDEQITDHNEMGGLQGGADDERYHVGADQAEALAYANAPSKDNPVVTRADVPQLVRDVGAFSMVKTPDGIGMLYDAAFGAEMFVAVGDDVALAATDPLSWSEEAAPRGKYRGAAYGMDQFVAVGLAGAAMYREDQAYSEWQPVASMPKADWGKIAFGNGVYVAVADGAVAVSPNGRTGWTKRTVPVGYGADVAFGNGIFVAVGKSGATTSADGYDWVYHALPSGTWRTVSVEDARIVALGGKCVVTEDVFATVEVVDTPRGGWDAVTHGNGFLAAVGGGDAGMIAPNWQTGVPMIWEDRDVPNFAMLGVAFGKDSFVAVGAGVMAARIQDTGEAMQHANGANGSNPYATMDDLHDIIEAVTWGRIE